LPFFSDLHRSIFDARFYREAIGRPWGRVALFLVKLLVFTSLVAGLAKAYYVVHSERGVAALAGAVFNGMEVRGGRLLTAREPPYAISGDALAELMNRLLGYPRFFDRLPPNFLVVDTRPDGSGGHGLPQQPPWAAGTDGAPPAIVLREASAEFANNLKVPYTALFGKSDLKFTAAAIQEYLNGKRGYMAMHFIIISLFFEFFSITLCALFLSLAAYVFSANRRRDYRRLLRLACYSVTPVALGAAIVALSGVSAEWTWHVFIVISTIIMFRSMANCALDAASEEKREARP
jgi:hypothetical protein